MNRHTAFWVDGKKGLKELYMTVLKVSAMRADLDRRTRMTKDRFIYKLFYFYSAFCSKPLSFLCSKIYFCLFFFFFLLKLEKVQHRPETDFGLLVFCMQNHVKISWVLYKLEHYRICITDSIAGNHSGSYRHSERWVKDSISPLLLCFILALRLYKLLTIMFGSLGEHMQQIAAK